MENSIKLIKIFLGYCFFSSLFWNIYFQNEIGDGDNAFLPERWLMFSSSILVLFLYGYLSKLKFEKSFYISQAIIVLILLFSFFISISNYDYYDSVIHQSTSDSIKIVSEQVFYLNTLINEPFSYFVWKSAKEDTDSKMVLIISLIPLVSLSLGLECRKISKSIFNKN